MPHLNSLPEDKDPIEPYLACVQQCMPDFPEFVESARQAGQPVLLALDGFQHDFTRERVHACLWYALSSGTSVMVTLEQDVANGPTHRMPP